MSAYRDALFWGVFFFLAVLYLGFVASDTFSRVCGCGMIALYGYNTIRALGWPPPTAKVCSRRVCFEHLHRCPDCGQHVADLDLHQERVHAPSA